MPRKAIKIPDHIEYIAVLDEHGRLDTKLMPDLTEDQLRHLHRIMLLSRRFDERHEILPAAARKPGIFWRRRDLPGGFS